MKKKSIQMFIVMKWQKCSHCICSHSITDWFCFRMSKNYYTQVLLDECAFKEKEMTRNITEGLENFSDEESYEMWKKILTKKILLKNLSILVVFFFSEGAIWMVSFWGSNLERASSKMLLLRKQRILKKEKEERWLDDLIMLILRKNRLIVLCLNHILFLRIIIRLQVLHHAIYENASL